MAGSFSFEVNCECAGMKVKDFLRRRGVSARMLTRLKYRGAITVNGIKAFAADRLEQGDMVEIIMPPESVPEGNIEMPALSILYEDQYLLVIDKPPGMAVHPSQGNHGNTLADAVGAYYRKSGINAAFRPLSRLDKGTSGLLVVTKDAYVHKLLSDYMSNGLVKRRYAAIVEGLPEPAEGVIDLPIARKEGSVIAREVNPAGKPAVTIYRTLKSNGTYSLVEAKLLTGRTHQIRVHFSYLGHPLVGDWLYGREEDFISRPALHSHRLSLKHPITGRTLEFESKLAGDMQDIINKL